MLKTKRVNIYLATDSAKLASLTRWTAYVMEYEAHGTTATRETFKERTGTYHTVCLQMIAEALGRMKEKCEIHINCPDLYVANMMGSLEGLASNGFRTKSGELIKNHFEWRSIHERMQGHLINVESGRNQYSEWMISEMEKHSSDNKIAGSDNKTGTNDNK